MPPISFKEKIENHAQTISKRYGLSFKRVYTLLSKTTCLSYGTPIKVSDFNSVPAYENPEFSPSLSYVLDLLQPSLAEAENILNLIENRKLDVLASRLTLYKKLSPISQPLYSRSELISILNSFLSYLASNKDFLIQHGIPQTRFYQSPWLDEELRNLYFTRALVVKIKAPPFKEREYSLYEYERDFDYDEPQIEIYGFAKADESFPRSSGLEPQAESFLINKREFLFEIKRSVIEKSKALLVKNQGKSLWPETKEIISSKLSKDDINRLIELDEVISGYSVFNSDTTKSEFPNSGGLQNILSVISYLDDEINHSWFSKMHELLKKYLFPDDFNRQRLNFKSFYTGLGDLKPNSIDQAADLYREWQAHQDKWRFSFLRKALNELSDSAKVLNQSKLKPETMSTVKEIGKYPNGLSKDAFRYEEDSNDFSEVFVWGTRYNFDPSQAAVVEMLWNHTLNHKNYNPEDFPSLEFKFVLDELAKKGVEIRDCEGKIGNLFNKSAKQRNKAWIALIKNVPKKPGRYGLFIPLTNPNLLISPTMNKPNRSIQK